ncbi:MAG: Flagella basal body P-ring formation protein FlgA precursor [Candidatus Accumulibacter appositus]|uniref:Flagella basal body P-ring formation protein FlgA n=1 Tax=Candidatus Accumulibacter appositus TaxID=1454003 RepID=A0A011QRH4_9PROT|nr:flagellar basal body P-ring formation chaperone FlgA [Accumulibacter sp.]EXI81454.1 MAG: Flagella basal body P-ring formation protein FlgA precursor [Candidatus Accumulibacter appositus]HRF03305.1 flagellar basal body P-ring formation chaperone FlgA [Accumulibacter sp.]
MPILNLVKHSCRLAQALLILLLAAASGGVGAQASLSAALDNYLRIQTQGLPGKVSYHIGHLDQYAQEAACSAYEPFLPQGSRLWGRTTIGVRCLAPEAWTIYVPVQIRISGNYLVTARQLNRGQLISASDIYAQQGDLGALPASIVIDPAQAIGKTLKNGVAAGQPLRNDLLTAPWAVQQGQSVKLQSTGAGFSVSNEGKALNNASDGQIAQVRTASGQVVSGVARPGGIVEVTY